MSAAEPLPTRDYQTDFIAVADQINPIGIGADAVTAERIVSHLTRHDPDLLVGWLVQRSESIVRDWVAHRARSTRAYEQNRRGAKAFESAALALVDGDTAPMRDILDSLYIGQSGRMCLRDMTAADIDVAVELHRTNRDTNAFEVVFLEAIQRRLVADQTVGSVFTRQELQAFRT